MYVCMHACMYVCMYVCILHSAEEDNSSPLDSNIARLCQSIEINNNKHVYPQSQVRKPNGSEVKWAECSLIIGTGCWVQVFRQQTTMRNPSIFIVALRHVKNRQTLQGLNGHATYFWRTIFGQHFSSSFNIAWPSKFSAMLTNLTPPPFCGPMILHKKQATDFFTSQPAVEI